MSIYDIGKRGRLPRLVISLLTFLVALWVVSSAHAQQTTKKNFLWSLKTDKATIYLLGSVHLLKSDSYPLDKNIEGAYHKSTKVIFETDIGGMNTPVVQQKLMALGIYPEGQTLQQNISQETYSMLEKKAAAMGITMDQLNRLKPWSCALMLDGIEFMKMRFDPQYGVDRYFFEKAKKDGKETLFLETVGFQIKLLAQLNGKEGDAFLRQTLKELEVIETLLPDMVNAWKNGDTDRFGAIMAISYKDLPEIYDRFVVQRNKTWVGKIEDLMAYGDTALVVVGAGHLVGPDNLLHFLKGKGYTVGQIPAYAGVTAVSAEDLAHALYIKSGMEEQLRDLSQAIKSEFDKIRNQDDRMQQIPKDFYVNIKELLAESLAADNLNAMVLRHLEAQMSQAEMQKMLNWLESPFGRKCSNLFKTSFTPQESTELQEYITTIQKAPPPSTRRQLIQELAHATKTLETSLEIAVHTQLVVTTVITSTLPPIKQRPFSEILDEVEKNRPLLEPRVDFQITPLLLYIYRSLSDAELEQYIQFATSDIGTQFYRSLYNGIRLALMDASIRSGSAMADLQWRSQQSAEAR
jgi:uncharacterized protein YbaP (TraB family)